MATVSANAANVEGLRPHYILTVTAASGSTGSVTRLGDRAGETSQGTTAIAAGETVTIGPFATQTYHQIAALTGTLTYSIDLADFEAADETAKGAISALFDETATGTVTLLAAAREDRVVQIVVDISTAFADGDGAQPTLLVGETGDTDKFAAAAVFTDHAVGTVTLIGTLAADKALLLTQTAGTGTTETGGYTVAVIAAPLA